MWEELAFLGDTRSRHELLVFAQANQSRLPLAMGIVQPHIPVRRMASERKTKLTDALVRILSRFLTPATISMDGAHDSYYREYLLPLAAHGDGHVLTVYLLLGNQQFLLKTQNPEHNPQTLIDKGEALPVKINSHVAFAQFRKNDITEPN